MTTIERIDECIKHGMAGNKECLLEAKADIIYLTASLAEVTREKDWLKLKVECFETRFTHKANLNTVKLSYEELESSLTTLEAANKGLRELLEKAYTELNEIHARDGVPWTHYGTKASVDQAYFTSVVDECRAALTTPTPNAERTDGERTWTPQCDCHKSTPSYPVFRSQFHVKGCVHFANQQLVEKASEYQQVAALVCLKLDLLKMMAESPSLKEQVLLAHQDKEEIIKDPVKRAKEYQANCFVFAAAINAKKGQV